MSSSQIPYFRDRIASAYRSIQTISEQQSQQPLKQGGWSRKQILGHLIDSALNNHQRFVRSALSGFYEGPSYEQAGWVAIHCYDAMSWSELLAHWRMQNELLSAVVDRIQEAQLSAECRVGDNPPVTLHFLIDDYLAHLDHHVQQIAG
jgi:hypothetical protein